uniref:Lipocalin-like domain-containing protein n=1 Tax=Candidatus Kentrum sp. FW TaxID=2126338 RepID=A0A450T7D9_9GAMM|nr:MAG: Lipocalin-like domain-containing protein [Candidatus Kentron sp. FW]
MEGRLSNGERVFPMGHAPVGRLIYDEKGNMSVITARAERSFMSTIDKVSAPLEEKGEALDSFEAYFGTYTINKAEKVITHHPESSLFPNQVGTLQERFYLFEGNRLELSTPPMEYAGNRGIGVLVWERL